MIEIWKPIKEDNRYLVSNLGRVKRAHRRGTERILCTWLTNHGYPAIHVIVDSKKKLLLVHRLVAEAFIENLNCLPVVNHIDGKKINNDVRNLEWCTPAENNKHAFTIGLKSHKGVRHPRYIHKLRHGPMKYKLKKEACK